jgi:hypothetical protein
MEEEFLSNTCLQSAPATSAAMAAFLAKLPFLTGEQSEKVETWGSARYKDFRLVLEDSDDGGHCCLAGGLFREQPMSLHHLQRLFTTNLKNWGLPRPRYQRGWLRLVPRDEAREQLGLKAEAESECAAIVLQMVNVEMWKQVDANAAERRAKRDARREEACRRLAGLEAPRRSLEIGFGALAAATAQKRVERVQKTARFNSERFGLAGVYVNYTRAELEECQDWAAVKRRRLSEPRTAREERDDTLCARAALERAAQCSEPVGL